MKDKEIYTVKFQYTYSEEVREYETDSKEDAYKYFEDTCKFPTTAKCKLYKGTNVISVFINTKWQKKRKK